MEYGSEYGAIGLALAETYTSATIFSVDGETMGQPLAEHMHWANIPRQAIQKGMMWYQTLQMYRYGLNNFTPCPVSPDPPPATLPQ